MSMEDKLQAIEDRLKGIEQRLPPPYEPMTWEEFKSIALLGAPLFVLQIAVLISIFWYYGKL